MNNEIILKYINRVENHTVVVWAIIILSWILGHYCGTISENQVMVGWAYVIPATLAGLFYLAIIVGYNLFLCHKEIKLQNTVLFLDSKNSNSKIMAALKRLSFILTVVCLFSSLFIVVIIVFLILTVTDNIIKLSSKP